MKYKQKNMKYKAKYKQKNIIYKQKYKAKYINRNICRNIYAEIYVEYINRNII